MPKITALSNIKHDGKDYVAGDTLDVNKSDAEYLVKLGAAEAGGKGDKKPTAAEVKAAAEAEAAKKAAAQAAQAAASFCSSSQHGWKYVSSKYAGCRSSNARKNDSC